MGFGSHDTGIDTSLFVLITFISIITDDYIRLLLLIPYHQGYGKEKGGEGRERKMGEFIDD